MFVRICFELALDTAVHIPFQTPVIILLAVSALLNISDRALLIHSDSQRIVYGKVNRVLILFAA
jgi:hypothetical protein